jgi:hypothetical protein
MVSAEDTEDGNEEWEETEKQKAQPRLTGMTYQPKGGPLLIIVRISRRESL